MTGVLEAFDKEYRETCFYSWYSAGCPKVIRNAIPEAKDGRKPTSTTLMKWLRDDGWRQRADAMDAEMSITVDREIIERKKQDYLQMSETGRELLKTAMDYLKEEGFDTASAAVRAIAVGSEMVSKYSRAAEMVDAVLGKTDKQIEKEIYRLLGKNTMDESEIVENGATEEIVDEVGEVEEDVDADSDTEENNNSD